MKKIRYYKGIPVSSFVIPIFDVKKYKEDDKIRVKKNRTREDYHTSFSSGLSDNSSKNLIVMYDIPSDMKKERDWFRRHLKRFNYIMVQKSVWVGPSPLPKDFLEYVTSIG